MKPVPPEVLMTWPKPNYVNPQSRAHSAIISGSICMAIIFIVISVRVYTRWFVVRWFGADDWLAIPAAVTGLAYCILTIVAADYGWYIHIWDVPRSKIENAQKSFIAAMFLGLLNVCFTKISILCLYRRLTPEPWFRTMVNTVLGIVIAWMGVTIITNFLVCIPYRAFWDLTYAGQQKCFDLTPYFISFAAIDLALDVIVWTMPLFFIIPMRLPRRQKWTLFATFATGLLTIAAAALRLPSLIRTSETLDWPWEVWHAAIWTQIEAAVSLFCASVPTLKPFVARYAPTILGSSLSSNKQQQGYSGGSQMTNQDMTSEERRLTITKTTQIDTLSGTRTTSKSDDKHDDDIFGST